MVIPQPHTIRVVIADDHELIRQGFQTMLKRQKEISIIGAAEDGMELIELVAQLKPDVVITDIKMPRMDGIEATRVLSERFPGIGVIALTMYEEDSLIIDMLDAGALGYLVKNASKQEVIEAINTVNKHKEYYCRRTTHKLANLIAKRKFQNQSPELTAREMEIIRLICKQYSTKEIGAELHLSPRTIEGIRDKILEKIDVRNTAGIVVYAIKAGIFKPD